MMDVEEVVHHRLLHDKVTLSVAESCTGGMIAHLMTKHPKSSKYFLGGVVSYSNDLKEKLLGVPKSLIERHGAVSEEVAIAMCKGMESVSGSMLTISVTGVAGPDGGTEDRPVGSVWGAIKITGKEPVTFFKVFEGTREKVILQAAHFLLLECLEVMEEL